MLNKAQTWLSGLLSCLFIMNQEVQGCRQAELTAIKNSNGIITTDERDDKDELGAWIGINDYFMYTWKDTMEENQHRLFETSLITMPCFNDSVLWFEIEEEDAYKNDKASVAITCKNLALGSNEIVINVITDG